MVIIVGFSGNDIYTREGLVVKLNETGKIEWSKIFGVDSNTPPPFTDDMDEIFDDVIVTPEGEYLISGTTRNYNMMINYPFLIKLSKSGEILWSQKADIPQEYDAFFKSITIGKNGNYLITGSLQKNNREALLLELSPDGVLISGKIYFCPDKYIIFGRNIIEKQNAYFIIGQFNSSQVNWDRRRFITKISKEGTFLWAKSYTPKFEEYLGLEGAGREFIESNNYFYIGGILRDRESGSPKSACIIKCDTLGYTIWSKTYYDTTLMITEDVAQIQSTNDGDLIINFSDARIYYDTFYDFIPQIDEDETFSLTKIDPNGNLLWNRLYGGQNREPYAFMDMTQEGGAVVAGSSFSFTNSQSALYVLKTDTSGYAGTCHQSSLDIIVEDIEIEEDTFSLEVADFGELVPLEMPVVDVDVTAIDLCPPAEVTHLDYDWCPYTVFQGVAVAQDTIFSEAQLTVDGLDSFIYHHVHVLATVDTFLMATILEGDSLFIGTSTYTQTGVYTDTLIAANGCDSLVHLDLTVLTALAEVGRPFSFQAVPNPFTQELRFYFELPVAQEVVLKVLDMYGRTVAVLEDGRLSVGQHQVTWWAGDFPAGVYWVQGQSEKGDWVEKVVKQ